MSEAEKYQKGLYKGPKGVRRISIDSSHLLTFFSLVSQQQQQRGGPRGNANGYGNGRQSQGTYQPRGRNGSSWGAGRPGGYARYEASGANGTPLGTPVRMSPVTTPVGPPSPKADTKPARSTVNSSGEVKDKGGEKKEKKKRKAEAVEDAQVSGRRAELYLSLHTLMSHTRR